MEIAREKSKQSKGGVVVLSNNKYMVLILIMLLLTVSACGVQETGKMATIDDVANKKIGEKIATVDDLARKKLGVPAGSVYDKFAMQRFPAATIQLYNELPDLTLALTSGKVDAGIHNLHIMKSMVRDNPDLVLISDDLLNTPVGIGFHKNNPALRDRFNAFLKGARADGSYDAMYKKWFDGDPTKVQMPAFPPNSGGRKVVLAVALSNLPVVGFVNGEYMGFDVEIMKTFAQKENLDLQVVTLEFPALIPALVSGKVDIIAASISITEERKEKIAFSDPYMEDKTGIVVLKKNLVQGGAQQAETNTSFLQGIRDSLYNNMIREDRYLLIIDGLCTTMVISVLSVIFGTAIGGLICFMRMSRRRILSLSARLYIALIRGIPVLVLLMLIYYVVFASVNIDPVLVAVAAFGINFAAYVSEMFRTAIESIDKGQTEAGIANGFSRTQTFVHIVMPQAVQRVLPVYKGELISLVKMTSVVGYIAVQDLTKASDIIRSRTFDAFFPLIMTAVLYFAISWLLLLLLEVVERKTDPRRQRTAN